MKTIKLTEQEYRVLTDPTGVEMWGAQQKIARNVQDQILALTDERVVIDQFDIEAINKAIEVNHEGAFISRHRHGGWPTTEWETSTIGLQRAMT